MCLQATYIRQSMVVCAVPRCIGSSCAYCGRISSMGAVLVVVLSIAICRFVVWRIKRAVVASLRLLFFFSLYLKRRKTYGKIKLKIYVSVQPEMYLCVRAHLKYYLEKLCCRTLQKTHMAVALDRVDLSLFCVVVENNDFKKEGINSCGLYIVPKRYTVSI